MGVITPSRWAFSGIRIVSGLMLVTFVIATSAMIIGVALSPQWEQVSPPSYDSRFKEITRQIGDASSKVDDLLAEMQRVSAERTSAILTMENQLDDLSAREQGLQSRIEELKEVPIPVAEHFADLVEAGERKAEIRDYALFFTGVVSGIVVDVARRRLDRRRT